MTPKGARYFLGAPGVKLPIRKFEVKRVRCDVGVVYAPNGPYSVAIMAKQVTGDYLETDLALAAVSRAIYDELVG